MAEDMIKSSPCPPVHSFAGCVAQPRNLFAFAGSDKRARPIIHANARSGEAVRGCLKALPTRADNNDRGCGSSAIERDSLAWRVRVTASSDPLFLRASREPTFLIPDALIDECIARCARPADVREWPGRGYARWTLLRPYAPGRTIPATGVALKAPHEARQFAERRPARQFVLQPHELKSQTEAAGRGYCAVAILGLDDQRRLSGRCRNLHADQIADCQPRVLIFTNINKDAADRYVADSTRADGPGGLMR